MMWYVIIGEDAPDSLELRKQTREAHLARMSELVDAGRVLVAGPCPAIDAEDPGAAGFSGSVLIIEFPSLEDAESWAQEDPYVEAGVYRSVTVRPFRKVLP